MEKRRQVLLCGALIATSEKIRQGALLIEGERIGRIWYADGNGLTEHNGEAVSLEALAGKLKSENSDLETVCLDGKVIMAGGIDAHVHFREPGMTAKADMSSESRAALLGGITSFIDMPNTNPPATGIDRIREKAALADGRSYANWGFHIGADNENPDAIASMLKVNDEPREFAAVKVFMGSSTGNMLVDHGEALEKLFGIENARILIHSEDEATIKAKPPGMYQEHYKGTGAGNETWNQTSCTPYQHCRRNRNDTCRQTIQSEHNCRYISKLSMVQRRGLRQARKQDEMQSGHQDGR